MRSSLQLLARVVLSFLLSVAVPAIAMGVQLASPQAPAIPAVGVIQAYQPAWTENGLFCYRVKFYEKKYFDALSTKGTHEVTYTEVASPKAKTKVWRAAEGIGPIPDGKNLSVIMHVTSKKPTRDADDSNRGTGTAAVIITGDGDKTPYPVDGQMDVVERIP